MGQGEEDSAIRVQSRYQGKPWIDLLECGAGRSTLCCPHAAIVLGLVQRALIDIDDSLARSQELYHPQSVLLSLYQTPLRVGLDWYIAGFAVSEVQLFPHAFAYLRC
jgi:hypothetical protein